MIIKNILLVTLVVMKSFYLGCDSDSTDQDNTTTIGDKEVPLQVVPKIPISTLRALPSNALPSNALPSSALPSSFQSSSSTTKGPGTGDAAMSDIDGNNQGMPETDDFSGDLQENLPPGQPINPSQGDQPADDSTAFDPSDDIDTTDSEIDLDQSEDEPDGVTFHPVLLDTKPLTFTPDQLKDLKMLTISIPDAKILGPFIAVSFLVEVIGKDKPPKAEYPLLSYVFHSPRLVSRSEESFKAMADVFLNDEDRTSTPDTYKFQLVHYNETGVTLNNEYILLLDRLDKTRGKGESFTAAVQIILYYEDNDQKRSFTSERLETGSITLQ